jgi:putative transposase
LVKANFSRRLTAGEWISPSRKRKGKRGIWQRRYWEHLLRDEEDLARHVDYIHFNPVKHGYVERAVDWRYSSFHRYVREGKLTVDWAGSIGLANATNAWGE